MKPRKIHPSKWTQQVRGIKCTYTILQKRRNFKSQPVRFRIFVNTADFYVEVANETDITNAFLLAKERDLKTFVLGAGSNVFFKNAKIKSALIKNNLPKEIKHIDRDLFEVSSSVDMLQLLNFAFEQRRDCCYYLASAPCQIGGAIVMNAGSGKKEAKYICNFIIE